MKRPLWILLVTFLLSACEQSAPTLLPTPTPAATSTCYVIVDVTSSALFPVESVPTPASKVSRRNFMSSSPA